VQFVGHPPFHFGAVRPLREAKKPAGGEAVIAPLSQMTVAQLAALKRMAGMGSGFQGTARLPPLNLSFRSKACSGEQVAGGFQGTARPLFAQPLGLSCCAPGPQLQVDAGLSSPAFLPLRTMHGRCCSHEFDRQTAPGLLPHGGSGMVISPRAAAVLVFIAGAMYRRNRVAALSRADAPDCLPAEPILQAAVAPVAPPLRRRLLQEEPLVLSPAAARLRDEFQELYNSGAVRAPTLVKLAWHIREAGDQAPAAVRDLAIDPSTPGYIANSARLLHNRFGYSRQEQHLYRLPVPVDTLDGRRMTMFPIIPPHEAIAAAYANNPAEFLVGDRDVPPDFVLHPLTRAYGTNNTFPLQIFVDAAGFTKKDSFVSFLMSSIYPGARRFCLAVVRKAELCSCGCRGLHTLDPIEAALVWGFRAGRVAHVSTRRHAF